MKKLKKNPYRAAKPQYVNRKGAPLESLKAAFRDKDGKVRKSGRLMVDQTSGEFNAHNKKELMSLISNLVAEAHAENITAARETLTKEQVEERVELLSEALSDRTGQQFRVLGETMADTIEDHVYREGAIRKFIDEQELLAGQNAKVRVRKNWTKAVVMGQADFQPYLTAPREKYFFPPEYYVEATILVEDKDTSQTSGDLLTERLQDGQEQIQVQEDTVFKRMCDTAVTASSNQILFTRFDPGFFQTMKQMINCRGIPVRNAWISGDLWDDIIAYDTFSNWFDPVSKHELIMTGTLGSILGVTLTTDAFVRHELRVLNSGEVYFLGDKATLGKLFIRQTLKSEPIDQYNLGRPVRGWYLSGIQACAVPNINAIARGRSTLRQDIASSFYHS